MSVTSQDVINLWLLWIIFLNLLMFINYNFYKLILFSLTGKLCQIMYTNVFNDHSQLKQWSHDFFIFNKFVLTKSSLKIFTNWISIKKRRCSSRGVFCECAALLGSLFCMGVLLWLSLRICGTFLGGIITSGCLFLSTHVLLVTQFL